jgi:hypothetical protein
MAQAKLNRHAPRNNNLTSLSMKSLQSGEL